MMTLQQRIDAALKAGWTHIRSERTYADGIPPGCPKPHPFGAHNYQELPKTPIPEPFTTHGLAIFWHNHGCPKRIGAEITVAMTSGRDAIFRLSKVAPAAGVDWSWYDFDFVRYVHGSNA